MRRQHACKKKLRRLGISTVNVAYARAIVFHSVLGANMEACLIGDEQGKNLMYFFIIAFNSGLIFAAGGQDLLCGLDVACLLGCAGSDGRPQTQNRGERLAVF